ncbi:MAG TPA: hypothetical protein VJX10_10495 [Pseudonocardiaceae bacterium]|nr:hypothetical protein [Pseudonocardiaceae bacterium]
MRRVDRVLTEHRPALEPFDWDADLERVCGRFTARLAGLTTAHEAHHHLHDIRAGLTCT